MREEEKNNPDSKQVKSDTKATITKQNDTREKEQNNTDANKKEDEENAFAEDALALAGLSLKERIVYKKSILKKRLSTMDTKERRKYLIHYYKWHFLATICILFLVSWCARAIYNASLPTPLKLAIVNHGACEYAQTNIPKRYREFYDLSMRNHFNIYTDLEVSKNEDTTQVGNMMTDYQQIGFYCTSNMLDALIVDDTALQLFKKTYDTTAIDYVISDELYQKVKDHIIMANDETGEKNNGNPYALALEITDTEFVKENQLNSPHVYLLIPICKQANDEDVENFIRFVYHLK